MKRFATLAGTLWSLGIPSVLRVAAYRIGLRSGLHPVLRIRPLTPRSPFFKGTSAGSSTDLPEPVESWQADAHLFGRWPIELKDGPPAWVANPLTAAPVPNPMRPWWQIPDFDPAVGDIKLIWEQSRMDWLLAFAQRARKGDKTELERIDRWLSDWIAHNPAYLGPNWKCGQEASIRVMHIAAAALILNETSTASAGVRDFLIAHLQRIEPTMSYAIGQDNNHGTSEAAALFVGGSWLEMLGVARGGHWARIGRKWLEDRARHLIGEDGSFSQYSLNYHRVMLDTYSLAEAWRVRHSLAPLPTETLARLKAAAQWLRSMIDLKTGDGPNLGANDGARLLQLTNTTYRDFRPSVQLAYALFFNLRAVAEAGPWDDAARWLGVPEASETAGPQKSFVADEGGFAGLRRGEVFALLRYSRFRFRPSQADALHVDLWHAGCNLLRDAGTYSYNTSADLLAYFGGTASHNTIMFDGRDQMPRLERFLFGKWLRTTWIEPVREGPEGTRFGAGYRDGSGATHRRSLLLDENHLEIVDDISGFREKAVLRWRLIPGNWAVSGNTISNGNVSLTIESNVDVARFELVEGQESLFYLDRTEVPVVELEVREPCRLRTQVRWSP
jgi:hypothetical protein